MSDTGNMLQSLFFQHATLIVEDPTLFRKRVVKDLKSETGLDRKEALREYDRFLKEFRKINPTMVEPLFRAAEEKRVVRRTRSKLKPDNECFSIVEIFGNNTVGRCQSFLTEEEARAKFETRALLYPHDQWVLIQGLGPNSEDSYRLGHGERELERNIPKIRIGT